MNYDRMHKRRIVQKAYEREGAAGWKLPSLWAKRAARLRYLNGVQLRVKKR